MMFNTLKTICTCALPYASTTRPLCPTHGSDHDSTAFYPRLITPPPPLPPPTETPRSLDYQLGYKAGLAAAQKLSGIENADQH